MTRFSRRLLTAALLVAIPLAALAVFLLAGGQDLKARLSQVSTGMPRQQVEDILGPPVLVLPIKNQRGHVLVWTDMRWQVDVVLDGNHSVIRRRCAHSNSPFRQLQEVLTPPP